MLIWNLDWMKFQDGKNKELARLEGIYFDDTDEDNGQKKLFQAFKDDDFLRAEFIYYL